PYHAGVPHEGGGSHMLSTSLLFTNEPTMAAIVMNEYWSGPPQAIVFGDRNKLSEILTAGMPPWVVVNAEKWKTVYVDPNLFSAIFSANLLTAVTAGGPAM